MTNTTESPNPAEQPAEVGQVQRPVGRWWHRLWPRNALGAQETAAMAALNQVIYRLGALSMENQRLQKKVRNQRAELHRLNKVHAAMWAGSRFTIYAQTKAELERLQREQKPAPSRPKHACDDPACAVCGHPWAL